MLTPLGLRPRHLVTLTLLRDHADEILHSLDAAQRETLYGLLQTASNGQHAGCATAVSETE